MNGYGGKKNFQVFQNNQMPSKNRKPPIHHNGFTFVIFNGEHTGRSVRFIRRKVTAKKRPNRKDLTPTTPIEKGEIVIQITPNDYQECSDVDSNEFKKWENWAFQLNEDLVALPIDENQIHIGYLVNTILPLHRTKNGLNWIKRKPNLRWFVHNKIIKFAATEKIEIGDEILLNYGPSKKLYSKIREEQSKKIEQDPLIVYNKKPPLSKRTKKVKTASQLNKTRRR